MAHRNLFVTFKGIGQLLQCNPQTVDRFNRYAQQMKAINNKKTKRTDDDYVELRNLEMRSKIYWSDEIGIYVPSTWVTAAIAGNSFRTVKVSKADIRASVFADQNQIPLTYRSMEKVKSPEDIVLNDEFRIDMILPQGQVRVVKAIPIFHDWSFSTNLSFDDEIIDEASLKMVLERASRYGGFGDFRPTFGRAEVVFGNQ